MIAYQGHFTSVLPTYSNKHIHVNHCTGLLNSGDVPYKNSCSRNGSH